MFNQSLMTMGNDGWTDVGSRIILDLMFPTDQTEKKMRLTDGVSSICSCSSDFLPDPVCQRFWLSIVPDCS